MKLFILYAKNGLQSGRVLGNNLARVFSSAGHLILKGREERLYKLYREGKKFDHIINVGWYKPINANDSNILNIPEAVARSSNKRGARIRFKQLGIPAPQLWLRASNVSKHDLPVIARTTHHMRGRGLWYCKTLQELNRATSRGATHFLKFIRNTREFRVHVMAPNPQLGGLEAKDYRVIKISEKLPGDGVQHSAIVKNHDSGWFFGYPKDHKDPVLPSLRQVGKQTIAEFGLHWGAVDIMVPPEGSPLVLEINSTPCLTDEHATTLERYTKAIGQMLGLEEQKQPPKINKNLASFLRRNNF